MQRVTFFLRGAPAEADKVVALAYLETIHAKHVVVVGDEPGMNAPERVADDKARRQYLSLETLPAAGCLEDARYEADVAGVGRGFGVVLLYAFVVPVQARGQFAVVSLRVDAQVDVLPLHQSLHLCGGQELVVVALQPEVDVAQRLAAVSQVGGGECHPQGVPAAVHFAVGRRRPIQFQGDVQ